MPISPNERPIGVQTLKMGTNDQRFEVQMNGAIRYIQGTVKVNLTNSGTAPTWKEDDILNMISQLQVMLNGKPIKIDTNGIIQFYKEYFLKGTKPEKTDPDTTSGATYNCGWTFILDFAKYPLLDDDISALLQTKNLSNLELVLVCPTIASCVTSDAPTVNSITIEYDIRDYFGTINGKNINDDTQITMTNIIEGYEGISLEANKTQFDADSQEIALKSGAGILQQLFMVKDDKVRSNEG